jgi:Peptidase MA superfamily/Tetratricopeptide repeat
VRVRIIIFVVAVLPASWASGEVIRLKNGRTIWADHVRENGSHVEYDIGDNSYAIPKSVVEHIDVGGMPPAYASSTAGAAHDLPAFSPTDSLKLQDTVVEKIIRDGHVDADALLAQEQKGNAELTAAAYFIAGKHEFERGDVNQARRYYEAALRFRPDNSTVLTYYTALLVRTGNAEQALSYAERAVRSDPDSPDALVALGYSQYYTNRTQEAIRSWKKSLQLRPDSSVENLVAKAEREMKAEADFSQRESVHFTVRFEGKQSSDMLRRELINVLEADYDDLVRALGATPRSSILVELYTEQAYFDVTRAPAWSGAVNDGKLRIPISGISSVTPELARTLKHELTHSFIAQIAVGRCPYWLNEGIAQLMEPKSLDAEGQALAQVFRVQREIPLNALEGSFMRLSSAGASLAYAESLAATQYISDTYGISDLQRILERIGQGSSAEAALRSTIHTSYADLEAELGKYLTSKYGD